MSHLYIVAFFKVDMMGSNMENNQQTLVIILVIALVIAVFRTPKYEDFSAKEWSDRYYACQSNLSDTEDELGDYEYALNRANSSIEDAKSYAWESYYDMGEALDYLETVDP